MEHPALNRGADRNHFVRVDTLVALFAEQLFDQLLDAWHSCLPTYQHDFIDLAGVHLGILHALPARWNGTLNEVLNHAFEFCAGQLFDQMLGTIRIGGDEG